MPRRSLALEEAYRRDIREIHHRDIAVDAVAVGTGELHGRADLGDVIGGEPITRCDFLGQPVIDQRGRAVDFNLAEPLDVFPLLHVAVKVPSATMLPARELARNVEQSGTGRLFWL